MCQALIENSKRKIVISNCTGGDSATTILKFNPFTGRWTGLTTENDGSGKTHHNHQECLEIRRKVGAN